MTEPASVTTEAYQALRIFINIDLLYRAAVDSMRLSCTSNISMQFSATTCQLLYLDSKGRKRERQTGRLLQCIHLHIIFALTLPPLNM